MISTQFATIRISAELVHSPAGPKMVRHYHWEGDTSQPVRIDIIEISVMEQMGESFPWPLKKIGETDGGYLQIFCRTDTSIFHRIIATAKCKIPITACRLMWCIGWTLIIWGLARPVQNPNATWWPVGGWGWSKAGGNPGSRSA